MVGVINQKALCKLIKTDNYHNIVNIQKDGFQYSDGYFVAMCDFSDYEVIMKLFKIGAIENMKDWKAKTPLDLSDTLNFKKVVKAEKTSYLAKISNKQYANVFKINDKYYFYDKKFIDIFNEGVEFKATDTTDADNGTNVPLLIVYCDDKFIGVVLPIRMTDEEGEIDRIDKSDELKNALGKGQK